MMKAVIVEDEAFLAKMLQKMIAEVQPDCEILTTVNGVAEAVDWFKGHPEPCIVFMDIQLSDGVCFDIFEEVDLSNKGIIFTTAYDEYMQDAFEFNSISYLLKPIRKEALEKSFEKIGKIRGTLDQFSKTGSLDQLSQLMQQFKQLNPRFRERFMIARADGYIQLPVKEVACFYVEEKVVNAYTFDGKVHVVDFSLEKLEEELNTDQFFRANRQFILNMDAIDRLENYFGGKLVVRLKSHFDIERIVVSRSKAGMLKRWLDR
ncbi:two-component system response regulator [Geofilum rubicundum JCM 15548]|uniref:Two-component system response regulator n=2 Tax=Geofilum TaxID=1236988 RepID=A0A0E9LQY1_9BACT|nr:two-component system response regulator [Geofilum rubicundum JCM 15548]